MKKIIFLHLKDITLLYSTALSDNTLNKRINYIQNKGIYFPYLTVQQDPIEKSFYLARVIIFMMLLGRSISMSFSHAF